MSAPISLDEVKKHRNSESCWVVIHGNVYDLTKFLSEHPGGEQTILDVGGQDGTRSFDDVGHSDDARELMKKYKIGPLIVEETSFMEDRWKWALVALGGAVVIGVLVNQFLNTK